MVNGMFIPIATVYRVLVVVAECFGFIVNVLLFSLYLNTDDVSNIFV